jgi:hypothetical protein
MATPVGTILCVGMLGLAAAILIIATVASAFVVIPLEHAPSTGVLPASPTAMPGSRRQYTTAV